MAHQRSPVTFAPLRSSNAAAPAGHGLHRSFRPSAGACGLKTQRHKGAKKSGRSGPVAGTICVHLWFQTFPAADTARWTWASSLGFTRRAALGSFKGSPFTGPAAFTGPSVSLCLCDSRRPDPLSLDMGSIARFAVRAVRPPDSCHQAHAKRRALAGEGRAQAVPKAFGAHSGPKTAHVPVLIFPLASRNKPCTVKRIATPEWPD
jgi:hypothetical protein